MGVKWGWMWILSLWIAVAGPAAGGDGVVALQSAAPSCRSTSNPPPRFVDCGNGTVTDNQTGLVWLKKANCIYDLSWSDGMLIASGLSDLPGSTLDDCDLSDGSSAGEWRLPSLSEWQTLVADAVTLGCGSPTLTNDEGTGCWSPECVSSGGCSFVGVTGELFWMATTPRSFYPARYAIDLTDGTVYGFEDPSNHHRIWLVRGGQ